MLASCVGYCIFLLRLTTSSLMLSILIAFLLSSLNFVHLWTTDFAKGSKASLCKKEVKVHAFHNVANHKMVSSLSHKTVISCCSTSIPRHVLIFTCLLYLNRTSLRSSTSCECQSSTSPWGQRYYFVHLCILAHSVCLMIS